MVVMPWCGCSDVSSDHMTTAKLYTCGYRRYSSDTEVVILAFMFVAPAAAESAGTQAQAHTQRHMCSPRGSKAAETGTRCRSSKCKQGRRDSKAMHMLPAALTSADLPMRPSLSSSCGM